MQPILKQTGINCPEIEAHFQVAIVELRQRWVPADNSADRGWPGKKDRSGSSVVCTSGLIFFHGTTELAKGHQHDAVLQFCRREIVEKCSERVGKRLQQAFVIASLTLVSIISGLRNVVDACGHLVFDHLRNQRKLPRKSVAG